jgi:hypothetical protein
MFNCHNYIVNLINTEKDLSPALEKLKSTIIENNAANDPQKLGQLLASYAGQSWFVLFEITDESVNLSPNLSNTNSSGSTISGETIMN